MLFILTPVTIQAKITYRSSYSSDEYIRGTVDKQILFFTGKVGEHTQKGNVRFIRLKKKGVQFSQEKSICNRDFMIMDRSFSLTMSLAKDKAKLTDGYYVAEFYIPNNKCYSVYMKAKNKKLTFYQPSSATSDKTAVHFVDKLGQVINTKRVKDNDFINSPSKMKSTSAQRKELEDFTNQLCIDCTTDYEKVKVIYHWVVENIYYNMQLKEGTNGNNNPYYVFKHRFAVCEGYGRLLSEMLSIQGISNVYLTGKTNSGMPLTSGKMEHAWLGVYADGRWFYVDPTWDSNNRYYAKSKNFRYEKSSRDFFDVTLETMSMTHKIRACDTGVDVNGFGVTFCDGLLTATSYEGKASSIKYPAKYRGMTIRQANSTRILGDFKMKVKSVYIPKGYTKLGSYAFQYYINMKYLSIPKRIKLGKQVLLSKQKKTKITRR